ncbi:DUF192 domain-containing protein [Aliidiomarina quisquiliarum]|uniref:DUF192 domain-containing protein n=1 Tax=Aliidiomarina quisquiliarum TaxID=2938947 RepID=UPI00208FCD8C|nr:DUF192 domain-containing protein [Aliidiomarina quisquiliarum]MCO4321760.1 DUF192 domain-containing protein [Aliidiomarina quisquiliarum]
MDSYKTNNVVLKLGCNSQFNLHTATSFRARLLGWRARGKCDGVWLKPCSSIQTFTVKQSFDVIWLNKKNEIVRLDFKVRPNRILSCRQAHSAIELPAGALTCLRQQLNLLI